MPVDPNMVEKALEASGMIDDRINRHRMSAALAAEEIRLRESGFDPTQPKPAA